MKKIKSIFSHIFIDGLSGMALGLFSTLIIGTIVEQIGKYIPGTVGDLIVIIAGVAKSLTGAGIGVGVASKFRTSPLVAVSAGVAGLVGAFSTKILAGQVLTSAGVITLTGPGEPLGAFVAALVGIELGNLVSGRTKVDIILTPLVTITSGTVCGLLLGPPISWLMAQIGGFINWGTEQQPILMGVIVSVVMGMCLTLPISSAAIGISLGLNGIAAGAACIGCSAQMIGFAVASYRENRLGGLIAQGIGTSMLQMPNIVKKPIVWLPPIISSAILGPISTAVLKMPNTSVGSGMGTSGLVGQISAYSAMTESGMEPWLALVEIIGMHILAPAILTLIISEGMRKVKLIKFGDLSLPS